ncbi:hypothetical protein GOBAR_DD29113 [Gossypium barbadense]|nr:hypothetical protein GOBAR_DD29113 [Gossypium barbadense]
MEELASSVDELWEDQESSSQSSFDTYLLGFVIANIVGLQYYRGKISGREMVGLVREPLNPYDGNALKVLNTRTLQVGHIERSVAAVLSPLIDSHLIVVEGIVPNSRSASNRYKIPCQIHIFARLEAFNSVKSAISRGGLELISHSDVSFTLSEAAVVKGNRAGGESQSLDKVFKLVEKNVSKKAAMEPIEPPNEVIISQLLLHQKEGLGWLLHKENSNELPLFWEEKGGEFVNVLTNYQTDKRPEPLRGGIFADDMGLGKTLTLLSLIAFDKFGSFVPNSGDAGIEEIVQEDVKKGKRGRGASKKGNGPRKKRNTKEAEFGSKAKGKSVSVADGCVSFSGRRTTLVVCPLSVFSSWITQIEEHTSPGKLKELKKYDIILTTYSTLATEESWFDSPMKKIEWWRVILDEAHVIKNANAQQSKAVTNLKATCRWVVTGTPIQNGSFDLFSLMAFLQFEPFSIKSYWRSLVQRSLAQGNKNGLSHVSNNPELLKKMVVMLQDGEDFDCPIRISLPVDVVITRCAHIFCRSCILKTLQRTKPCCPLCRQPLSQSDLFSAPPKSSEADHTEISSRNPTSSKVSALLSLLRESRDQKPATKSVVFSQFRTMLLLLEKPLTDAGFKILRLDGSMNAKKRAQVIEEFQVPGLDGPTVLLASLKASGAGINLTAASRVYLIEPWWNPAVEEQAMDRVHRIGQKEDVKIVRLIARNSIEERVLELQERKKKLATEAFGRKGPKHRKEVTIDDLRTLMSL